ncbi:MAG: transposase [Elusimicrobia bacterium]|nr:transposase [Elusimicrobiota bacterium]
MPIPSKGRERQHILELVEEHGRDKRRMLQNLGVPESTYYRWKKLFRDGGASALEVRRPIAQKAWNRLTQSEVNTILDIAKAHPELSPRLLAVKITDEQDFSVSESKVYHVLKSHGLMAPRPLAGELPAPRDLPAKAAGPDEIWQMDAVTFFVVNWGYYKLFSILDDFSRKVMAWKLLPDGTAGAVRQTVEAALKTAGLESASKAKPKLLSEAGTSYMAGILATCLVAHNIRPIFARPYHPQARTKTDRENRSGGDGGCLLVYCSPYELHKTVSETVERYNGILQESLKNVSPNDVHSGKQNEILKRREEKKRWTLAKRKQANLAFSSIR